MIIFPTNDISKIITINVNQRMNNICKFYAWLEINKDTPIEIKLMILDNCLFSSILYGVETWGDISCIKNQLQNMEIKVLKTILRVKCGTTNDVVLYELNRCSVIAKIKDRQYSFYKKILELSPGEAVISDIITLCQRSKFLRYYADLKSDNCIADKHQKEKRINESENSMCVYYRNFNFRSKSCIYTSFINDHFRYIISR